MKKSILLITLLASVLNVTLLAQNPMQRNNPDGADIFDRKGCTVCHDVSMERIAPSLQNIATIYQGDEDALVLYLKGERNAMVYPENAATMQPQLMKMKSLYEDEIRALARYIIESN